MGRFSENVPTLNYRSSANKYQQLTGMKDEPLVHTVPYMLAVLAMVTLSICVYGYLRCRLRFFDPLSTKLHVGDLDVWSLTHLTLFTGIGYAFPGAKLGVIGFTCGIVWELIEHVLGKSRPSWMGGWGDCDATEFEKENANWWFGRLSDIAMNGGGILLGNYIRRHKVD